MDNRIIRVLLRLYTASLIFLDLTILALALPMANKRMEGPCTAHCSHNSLSSHGPFATLWPLPFFPYEDWTLLLRGLGLF